MLPDERSLTTVTNQREFCEACHRPSDSTKATPTIAGMGMRRLPSGVSQHQSSATGNCTNCHGSAHTPQPHGEGQNCENCHGTSGSHAIHTTNDPRGPNITCSECHDTNNYPYFKSGTDSNGDGKYSLSETDVCNTCHSPGGSYNGVNSVNGSIGAKDNWDSGVYETTSTLQAGKEKWCAGCHDESPANSKSDGTGVNAPNVIGDEDGPYPYGVGWGFYKTGHGLEKGKYPASEGPAANLECIDCHDLTKTHIDHDHRTYAASSNNYQAGYRLKSVNGQAPLVIPRSDTDSNINTTDFNLCFQCHDQNLYINSSNFRTNFRDDPESRNDHWYHLQASGGWLNKWDSDWDGTADSEPSCPACHNVHGSQFPRMGRHGELISTPGTTDRIPALNLYYTPDYCPTLFNSTGGKMAYSSSGGAGTVANTGVCDMCHNRYETYQRTPNDVHAPRITGVYGKVGSNKLSVSFSEGVYTTTGTTGSLTASDFSLTDIDNGRTITSVTHTAGDEYAVLTLSSPLDSIDDIGMDTLAAASTTSIYDASDNAMDTTTVTISSDTTGPVATDLSPSNNATGVAVNSNLTFTLKDNESGVDWTAFSIQLTGDKGYSKTYTDLDTSVVSKTGTPWEYDVTVDPDVDFSSEELISVTINASDFLGNALVPLSWSFTTAPFVNSAPTLSWTGEMGYESDGVNPSHAEVGYTFEFRVKYTDLDNEAPTVMRVWVDVDNSGTYTADEKYDMTAVDSGDTDYTDGKLYSKTLTLNTAGNIKYRFEASDGTDAATGEPTSDSTVEVITSAKARNVPGEYSSIQAAINASANGDTVLVAPGTYNEQIQFNGKQIAVRSLGGATTTTISYSGGSVVRFVNSEGPNSILDGFTITGGNAKGGGIYINPGFPTIENCIITNNSSPWEGGGVFINQSTSGAIFINTVFSNNDAGTRGGGIYCNTGGEITLTDCTFTGNTATYDGGALYVGGNAKADITNCTFDTNTAGYHGGGLFLQSGSITTMTASTVSGNTASTYEGGGFYVNGATLIAERSIISGNSGSKGGGFFFNTDSIPKLKNCMITGNKATIYYGGGAYFNNCIDAEVINCTFSGNEAARGGGIYCVGSLTVKNTILYGDWAWENDNNEIDGNSFDISYSDIWQANYAGINNNVSTNPMFVNPRPYTEAPTTAGDYHLQPNSPCIDIGTSVGAPSDDIDGDSRPQGSGYDMGADEYTSQ
jgi:predicted outer membrane repeat protein